MEECKPYSGKISFLERIYTSFSFYVVRRILLRCFRTELNAMYQFERICPRQTLQSRNQIPRYVLCQIDSRQIHWKLYTVHWTATSYLVVLDVSGRGYACLDMDIPCHVPDVGHTYTHSSDKVLLHHVTDMGDRLASSLGDSHNSLGHDIRDIVASFARL